MGFDGRRVDPYNIKERRGTFQGSIWLGHMGLKWLLQLLDKLCTSQLNTQGLLEFFRDGYRTLEVSGMKNDRGTFIEISEFHSGSQQGGIRVPEGWRGAGWVYFAKELRRFFLNDKASPMSSSAVGRQHHEGVSVNFGKKRDLGKKFDNGKSVMEIHRPKSRAQLIVDAPRPTRSWDFKWKPQLKTLRITLNENNVKKVKWAWTNAPKQAHKAEANALAHEPRVKEVDQEPRGKEEAHDPRVDEEAHEPRVNEAAPRPDKGIWVPKQTQPVLGLVDQLELISRPSPTMVDHSGKASSSQVVCVSSSHRVLHDEDSETVDSVSEEDEITAEEVEEEESTAEEVIRDLVLHSSISAEPGIKCVTLDNAMEFEVVGLEKSTPLLLDEVSGHSSPTLPLAWSSRPDLDRSPIVCEPLAKIDPLSFSEFTEQYSGNVLALEEAMSLWVEQKYKEFGELVGMPIEGFEAECIALLRRIDAERKRGRYQPSSRKPTRSTKKGTRELRNLISTINYDGKKVASLRN